MDNRIHPSPLSGSGFTSSQQHTIALGQNLDNSNYCNKKFYPTYSSLPEYMIHELRDNAF